MEYHTMRALSSPFNEIRKLKQVLRTLSSKHTFHINSQLYNEHYSAECKEEYRDTIMCSEGDFVPNQRLLSQFSQIPEEELDTQLPLQEVSKSHQESTSQRCLQNYHALLKVSQQQEAQQETEPLATIRRNSKVRFALCDQEECHYSILATKSAYLKPRGKPRAYPSPLDEISPFPNTNDPPGRRSRRSGFLRGKRNVVATPPPNDLLTYVLSVLEPHDIAPLTQVTLSHILKVGEAVYRQRTASGQLGEEEHSRIVFSFKAQSGSRKDRVCVAYAVRALKTEAIGQLCDI